MLKRKRIIEEIDDDFFTKRKKPSKEFQNQISFQQNQINFQQSQINNIDKKIDHCIMLLNQVTTQQKDILNLLEPLKMYNQYTKNLDYFS